MEGDAPVVCVSQVMACTVLDLKGSPLCMQRHLTSMSSQLQFELRATPTRGVVHFLLDQSPAVEAIVYFRLNSPVERPRC